MRKDFSIDSFEEITLKGYVWSPDGTVLKAMVVLAHGMAETIERYDAFANFLSDHGYGIIGVNQRGHGPEAQMLGYLGEKGWSKMKEDLKHIVDYVKNTYDDIPVFIMGHSMGSFLVRDFIISYSYLVDGVILSGTGYPDKISLKLGQWLAAKDVKKHGDKHVSTLIDSIAFKNYNKKIKDAKTSFDWLSSDSTMVQAYIDNPYCGQIHPSSFFLEFSNGLYQLLYHPDYSNFKDGLPMLIFSGEGDPVGNYSKGVNLAAKKYDALKFDVKKILYPEGRHEMLNEVNRKQVFEDVVEWLDEINN
ncbi:alpha/beta hydrolase [Fusibacter bizertensis]|uniref:Alpha/beta hydrolase n=1 Tax=Fusibacter bizertensis TaxID=1488331 RepID=A0ABT6ND94_9FIRM|nr:alpha/beta hydrolase [Fusibacter bizertensis]MDH8678388.1 alpha/beta hydrolase [Fusibacter bizertensis]